MNKANNAIKAARCNKLAASAAMKISKIWQILLLVSFLIVGCFSKPRLWEPADKSHNHRLVTSFVGEIAVSASRHRNANVRMSIFDSISTREYKGNTSFALDSQLVLSGGEDSVIVYERKNIASCGDGRGVITYKLILSKTGSEYVPKKSVFLNYGCEYWGERMVIGNIKTTDSSIIAYGYMNDRSKDYPIWIEVIPNK